MPAPVQNDARTAPQPSIAAYAVGILVACCLSALLLSGLI